MSFKHGLYGEHSAYAGEKLTKSLGTIPVYIGTAPIHQNNVENVEDYDYNKFINKPMIINSYTDAKAKLGVSDDFKKFTLMEAVYAHFLNGEKAIAPIIVVNMADPSNKTTDLIGINVNLSGLKGNKVGYIEDSTALIETVYIGEDNGDGTSLLMTEGTDYTLSYIDGKIKINVIKSDYSLGYVVVNYYRIDTSDTVITPTVFAEALNSLDICEVATGSIPTVMLAPYYSKIKEYHDLMIAKATRKLADKWYIDVITDIKADSTTNTIAKAVTKKAEDGYNNLVEKVCYPMAEYNGKIYHLSTLAAVRMQITDTESGGVPYISPSNKTIFANAAVLEDGTQLFINETTANTANANGITTVNIIRGDLRLWGGCNANYNYANESKIDPEHLQDASIRMKHYMLNKLQYDYIDNVDNPIARRDIDSIIASVQQWLNSLVNEGKMLYATIEFIEDNNSVKDLVSGDFVFDVSSTNTPNAKSITFRTHYTTEGISKLTSGGAE